MLNLHLASISMPEPPQFRWLPAFLLLLAIPAAPQDAPSFASSTNACVKTGDNSYTDHAPACLAQTSDEKLGEMLLVRERYQAAIQVFRKIESPSARVWNEMGIAYQMLHDYKGAMHCYKESLKLNPRNPEVLSNLGTIEDSMRNFSDAERTYRRSLKLEPNSAVTLKNLGTNLLMQHKYEQGSTAYNQALALDPQIFEEHFSFNVNDPAPHIERDTAAYFKAKSCARAGLYDCAITFLRNAMDEGLTMKQVSQEEDFAPLRNTTAYANLIAFEK